MQILLACAKTMRVTKFSCQPLSVPRFDREARAIALEMCSKTPSDFQQMFHCSASVALQTFLRYQQFFADENELPAVLAYNGVAFRSLDAGSLSPAACSYAQRQLWITSFLYGLLRPFDAIRPYRLEGNLAFNASEGLPLFAFWRSRLTRLLIDAVREDDGVLVHLASKEMENLFSWSEVCRAVRVVEPQFLVMKGGQPKSVSSYSKSCRGAMTRFLLLHPSDGLDILPSFTHAGFRFSASLSHPDAPVFLQNGLTAEV